MALEISEEPIGEIRVLGLRGRLDTDTAADLELAAQDLIDTGTQDFVIDLSGVGYVSSAGLRVLLMIGKTIDGTGSLRLCGLNPTVRQVFDVAGFTQLFVITATRDEALPKSGVEPVDKSGTVAKPAVAGKAERDAVAGELAEDLAQCVARLLGAKKSTPGQSKVAAVLAVDAARLLARA